MTDSKMRRSTAFITFPGGPFGMDLVNKFIVIRSAGIQTR
jgi:hypothetical protein